MSTSMNLLKMVTFQSRTRQYSRLSSYQCFEVYSINKTKHLDPKDKIKNCKRSSQQFEDTNHRSLKDKSQLVS